MLSVCAGLLTRGAAVFPVRAQERDCDSCGPPLRLAASRSASLGADKWRRRLYVLRFVLSDDSSDSIFSITTERAASLTSELISEDLSSLFHRQI